MEGCSHATIFPGWGSLLSAWIATWRDPAPKGQNISRLTAFLPVRHGLPGRRNHPRTHSSLASQSLFASWASRATREGFTALHWS